MIDLITSAGCLDRVIECKPKFLSLLFILACRLAPIVFAFHHPSPMCRISTAKRVCFGVHETKRMRSSQHRRYVLLSVSFRGFRFSVGILLHRFHDMIIKWTSIRGLVLHY